MKPYEGIRTEEFSSYPDKADGMYRKASVTGNKRGGCKNKVEKAKHRRTLKHQNETSRVRQDYRNSKDKE